MFGISIFCFFFFSSRRRHTRCREVSWARRCVQETATQSTWDEKMTNIYKNVGIIYGTLLVIYGIARFFNYHPCHSCFIENIMLIFSFLPMSFLFVRQMVMIYLIPCLLYTSDAADDTPCVDLGGRRIIKKKNKSVQQHPTDTQIVILQASTQTSIHSRASCPNKHEK
eukprot:TRINITY_DN70370_c0_g1_i1.p1 TRINITY_DN70370_c0_g1~~TRINITY_DN70370_c0_g1_i1.p1  ORF type:complete len:168 (-),score=31.75 TRINITY_DN70370_c0_g1_i1:12-515(-)